MGSNTIIHQEFHQLGRAVWALGAAALVLLIVAASNGLPMSGWRSWAGFGSVMLLLGCAVAYGIHRMNRITLTRQQLRVGGETFDRADFDFAFGVQPPLVLSVDEQERVEEEWPLPPQGDMRIAGGSWGRRRGTSMLVLKLARSGQLLAVFSRRPADLDRALTEWLERPPED